MEEKHLLESWEIVDRDWLQTPVAVKRLVEGLSKELEEFRQQIEQLKAENQLLKEKVNGSSRNSHRAPSSDQAKPPKRQEKRKRGKKRGGQPGQCVSPS